MTGLAVPRSLRCFGIAALTLVTSCGSPGTDGKKGTASGSETLFVQARFSANSSVDNATSAADFETDFTVVVVDGFTGDHPTDATVTVSSEGGSVTLTYDPTWGYVGKQSGYYRTYTLDVRRGSDFLSNATATGPDIHYFTAPIGTDPLDATGGVEMSWAHASNAGHAGLSIYTDTFDVDDAIGSFLVPSSAIHCDPSIEIDNALILDRFNTTVPVGVYAYASSSLSVFVTNEHHFVAKPGC